MVLAAARRAMPAVAAFAVGSAATLWSVHDVERDSVRPSATPLMMVRQDVDPPLPSRDLRVTPNGVARALEPRLVREEPRVEPAAGVEPVRVRPRTFPATAVALARVELPALSTLPSARNAALPRPDAVPAVATAPIPTAPAAALDAVGLREQPLHAALIVARPAEDENAVRRTLRRYEAAYEELNVSAAADVWPSVDRRALARAFGSLRSQGLSFEQCDVHVTGATAVARCVGTARYVRKVGSSTPFVEHHEWTFDMAKAGETWKVSTVTATDAPARAVARRS
jgi:hypothetical protein